MRVFKRGSIYWYEFVHKSKRYQKSTKSRNERVATQIMSAAYNAVIRGEVGLIERKPVPGFDVAMKAFLDWSLVEHSEHPETYKRYKYSSARLLKQFRKKPLDSITPQDVETFKQARAKEKSRNFKKQPSRTIRPATVNRELACMRAMYNHTMKAHPGLANPVSAIEFLEENNLQDRTLTYAEEEKYLAAASDLLRDVATIILDQGMRPEEVFMLRSDRGLYLDDGYLKVLRGKTKAAKRVIYLTPRSLEILRRRKEATELTRKNAKLQGGGPLFPNERDSERCIESVQTAHTFALKNSGVAPFRPYDLRHTFATRAAEVVDLVTLAAILGHARIQMVLRYAHPTQHQQSSSMEKLQDHRRAREEQEKVRARAEDERRAASGLRLVKRSA